MDRHTQRAYCDTFWSIQHLTLRISYLNPTFFLRIRTWMILNTPRPEYYPRYTPGFAVTQDSSAHIWIEYFTFGSLNTLDYSRRKSSMTCWLNTLSYSDWLINCVFQERIEHWKKTFFSVLTIRYDRRHKTWVILSHFSIAWIVLYSGVLHSTDIIFSWSRLNIKRVLWRLDELKDFRAKIF